MGGRKDIFFSFCPIKDFTLKINDKKTLDQDYGHLFYVEGLKDFKGDQIAYFYLREENKEWKFISAGSGP